MSTTTRERIAPLQANRWCPKDSLGYRLKRTLHAWTRRFDAALRPLGVTHLQIIALGAINDIRVNGEIPSQVRVAEWMHQDTMMLSKMLRLLEERGFLERSAHPEDPRANALALTPAGVQLLQRGVPLVREAHEAFFGRLPDDERRALAGTLDHLLIGEE